MKKYLFFKRFLASLLLCMVSTFLWAYDFMVDGIYYNRNADGTSVSVTYMNQNYNSYSGHFSIPSTVTDGGRTYKVTGIGESAFRICSGLTSVTIPEGVTSIGSYAFSGCSGLTSVTIPESVTSISYSAFSNCSSLTSITIPESVTSIDDYAFFYCTSLTSVTIPESVTSIGNYAFQSCTSLTSVTIPESVTSIGSYAFYNCRGLTSVTISEGVTSIGNCAFYNCSSLTSITIPESVTSIGNNAFRECRGLTSVTIPNSVTSIGDDAFYLCTGLEKAEFASVEQMCKISYVNSASNPLYYAHHFYIGGKEVTELVIPNSVTSIGNYAFQYCTSLTSVTIPEGVTSIGSCAFYYCTSLTSVTIPEGVTSIGSYAFLRSGLTSVTIPESVTSIGNYAFDGCTGLEKAEFASVEQMCKISYGDYYSNPLCYAHHFYIGGKEVAELVIPNSVTSIGNYAFYGCSGLTSVTIPESVTSIGNNAFYSCRGLTSVTIPESVTSIGNNAFYSCRGLTSVTILEGVTSIGNYAFQDCTSLTSVTIPESVTSIGDNAFSNCSSITSITIPESVTSIGDNAFYYCTSLTSVTIPESVTSIGNSTFSSCYRLTSVTIPEGVTSIGNYAFSDCSSLTRVVCYAENPPETGNEVFYCVPLSTAELYVSQSALDKYKNASPWDEFGHIYSIYDGDLKLAKEFVADRAYPYASEDAKNAAQEAMAAVAKSPEDATQKAEALLKAYRQYAESHAMLEGCPGAKDMTNYIKNPKAEEAVNSAVWQTVLGEGSRGSIRIQDNEPWTDSSDNVVHRYFDSDNWNYGAWDVTFKQDITLPAGRYLLTAMGRSSGDVAMTLFAGDATAEMAHVGNSGGLFNNGWEQTSVEFELQKAATVSIGVRGVASAIHQWMSFSDFRLVQFHDIVVVDGIVYDVKSENLFVNGSFDNGVDGWKTVGYETDAVLDNFVYSEQGGYDGGAYITTNAAGKDSETSIHQSVSVVPGKTYYFSVYTSGKSPNAENYQYNALFKMTDAHTENGVIKAFEWPQGAKTVSTDWSQTEFVFTAESNFVGVRMSWNEGAKFDGFVLYEVAGRPSIELALANLDKALAAARAEAGKYNVGNGLFQYSEAEMAPLTRAIAVAQAAYDAAESKEAAEDAIEALNAAVAAFAPAMTLPVADQAYLLSLTTSEGTFRLNMEEGIRIAEEGTPVFLVAQGDGTYALATVNGEYVNYAGDDKWNLAASADAYGWTIAALADGGYTITGKNGLLGTNTSDGNAAGSLCFGDKKNSNGNCIWNIEETETPAPAPEVYAIEIAECKNGSVTANVSEAKAGETISLTVTPSEGYELETLTVTNVATNASISVSKDNTFTMPEANVMVSATFKEIPVPYYSIEINDVQNGTVTADVSEAKAGDTVTLTVTPAKGYELGMLTVFNVADNTVIDVSADYTFTMPEANVKVSATFVVPTGIDAVGADAVKANGKYLENGRVVIYRNGIKYGADGSVVK